MQASFSNCPCCSGEKYDECCKIYHEGIPAPTALALMRSRYSAYALGLSEYILNTTHPKSTYFEKNRSNWKAAVKRFSQETKFLRLEIHEFGEDWVVFTASLEQRGQKIFLREKSHFQQLHGKWLYLSGIHST